MPSQPSSPARPSMTSVPSQEGPRFRPRACARCSNSKLKCNWASEPGSAPCERCARLKTECQLPTLKPRGPRRANPTRVGQLEQKLDGIMSLLTASKATPATTASPVTTVNTGTSPEQDSPASASTRGASTSAPSPDSSHSLSHSQSHSHSHSHLLPHRHASGSATPVTTATSSPQPQSYLPPLQPYPYHQQAQQVQHRPTPPPFPPPEDQLPPLASALRMQMQHPLEHIDVLPGLKVTFHDADLALDEYRKTYSPHFPFVPLPTDLKAFDFYQTHPFLLKVILQVVLPQPPQMQRDGKRWFREQIALHVVTDEQKDVSLLQAILLYVAWFDLGFYIDPKVTPLLQLAVGLVSDLGLHRPVRHEMSLTLNAFIADAATALRGFGHERPPHTLQGIRAMLGCYYVCALSNSFFRRTPVFPFTAYMEQCCERLEREQEFTSDSLAVAFTRMQRVAARIYAVLPNPELDVPPAAAFAPVSMAMAALRQELDTIVHGPGGQGQENTHNTGLSPAVRNYSFLWTHYYAILVRLYEPAIYLRLRTASASAIDLADTGLRTEALWNCLQATRDFFDAYTAVPPEILGILPLLATVHLSFSIVTLTRLLSLDAPEWHIGQARRSFDFVELAMRLERLFQAADEQETMVASAMGGTSSTQSTSTGVSPLGRKRRYAYFDTRTILATQRDKMRWIRIWYTTKMPPDPSQGPPRTTMAPAVPWSAESAVVAASTSTNQSTQSAPTSTQPFPQSTTTLANIMDVDTDSQNQSTEPTTAPTTTPSGLNVPLDEFDSSFWKAIFDLDNAWEPMAG